MEKISPAGPAPLNSGGRPITPEAHPALDGARVGAHRGRLSSAVNGALLAGKATVTNVSTDVRDMARHLHWAVRNTSTGLVESVRSRLELHRNRALGDGKPFDPVHNRYDAHIEADALEAAFETDNHWAAIRGLTSKESVAELRANLRLFSPDTGDALLVETFRSALQTLQARRPEVAAALDAVSTRWMNEGAWVYTYPQHFDRMRALLPVYAAMGVRTLEFLPHLAHGGVDGGYDIKNHGEVAAELGGNAAFARFMDEARAQGLEVVTDMVANHVSDQHVQFERLRKGDASAARWFVEMNDAHLVGTMTRPEDGLPRLMLQHGHGEDAKVSTPWHVFDFASKDNLLKVPLKRNQTLQFWHTFYPQQPDLNLKNPDAYRYIIDAMGWHANEGVLGMRLDAVPHVSKEPGTDFEDLPQTFAFEAALAAYWRLVQPKGVILPEVGKNFVDAAKHFGEARSVNGIPRNSQGDILFGFDLHAAYRAALLTGDGSVLHDMNAKLATLPPHATWALWMGGHHDELRWDLIAKLLKDRGTPQERIDSIEQGLVDRGGLPFAGRGYGIRHADMLGKDTHRIASSFVTAFAGTRSIPLMYAGDELCLGINLDEMRRRTEKRNGVEDTRDAMREMPSAEAMQQGLEANGEPLAVFKALNALQRKMPAFEAPVQALAGSVYAVARKPEGGEGIVVLTNLNAETKTVRLPLEQLERALGWSSVDSSALTDLLARQMGIPDRKPMHIVDGALELELGPHDYAILGRG